MHASCLWLQHVLGNGTLLLMLCCKLESPSVDPRPCANRSAVVVSETIEASNVSRRKSLRLDVDPAIVRASERCQQPSRSRESY